MHRADILARPGSSFDADTGRLYRYDGSEVTVFFPWPQVLAFRREVLNEDWKALQPKVRVPGVDTFDRGGVLGRADADTATARSSTAASHVEPLADVDDEADRRYWALVPAGVRRAIAPYPEGHWRLLSWMARTGDAAQDLVASNPSLAFALAHYREFRAQRGQRAERDAPPFLVREKQRRILLWLGFPPTESVRRILQKIEYRAINVPRLLALRPRLAADEVRRRLAHVPGIDAVVLRMAGDGTLLTVTPRVLREMADHTRGNRHARTAALLRDVARMWRILHPQAALPTFHRLGRIAETHDRLAEEATRAQALSAPDRQYPDAPLPGTEDIIPLTTCSGLVRESEEQGNCVASYAASVARGHRAIYRVVRPERATLSLVRRRSGWHVDQLKGPRNSDVSAGTRRAIREWLDASHPRRAGS